MGTQYRHTTQRSVILVPPAVVAAFLSAAEAEPGAVLVLGRTWTDWNADRAEMMKHHCFEAREAMGWLRLMRQIEARKRDRGAAAVYITNSVRNGEGNGPR